jgi:hypothetical protein
MWSFGKIEVTINALPNLVAIMTRVFLIQEVCFVFLFVRNHCGLYKFFPLHDLSQSD